MRLTWPLYSSMHGRTRVPACQAVSTVHLVHQERAAPWWLVLAPGQSPETQIWAFKSALLGRCLVCMQGGQEGEAAAGLRKVS